MQQGSDRSTGQVIRIKSFSPQRPRQYLVDEDTVRLATETHNRCNRCAHRTYYAASECIEVSFSQKISKIKYGKNLQSKTEADQNTRQNAPLSYIAPTRKRQDKQEQNIVLPIEQILIKWNAQCRYQYDTSQWKLV